MIPSVDDMCFRRDLKYHWTYGAVDLVVSLRNPNTKATGDRFIRAGRMDLAEEVWEQMESKGLIRSRDQRPRIGLPHVDSRPWLVRLSCLD